MKFGKQAARVWLVTLSVLIAMGLSVVIGAAQGDGQPSRALKKDKTVFLPLVANMKPTTTLPFADDFGQNMSEYWTVYPFEGEDWDQDRNNGYYWYDYDSAKGDDKWGLSMFLGPGSELWTDYEVITELKVPDAGSPTGGLAGIWIRGSYAPDGRIGGYYIHLKKRTDEVDLWRINPGARDLGDAELVLYPRYVPGIGKSWFTLKVRTQGANIKAWLKSDGDYTLLFDWTDPQAVYTQGTVGLSAYRSRATYRNITVTEISSSSQ